MLFSPGPANTPSSAPITGAFTVLLLGSDDDSKFSADHVLTQSMILVRSPVHEGRDDASIPRDLYVHLSTGVSERSTAPTRTAAPARPSPPSSRISGPHDDYIWVGLLGLVKLIDAIGGIDVVTSNPVLDDFYPADIYGGSPYGYERVAVLAGPQHLDGRHAMQYVRSRHGDLQSDFGARSGSSRSSWPSGKRQSR